MYNNNPELKSLEAGLDRLHGDIVGDRSKTMANGETFLVVALKYGNGKDRCKAVKKVLKDNNIPLPSKTEVREHDGVEAVVAQYSGFTVYFRQHQEED